MDDRELKDEALESVSGGGGGPETAPTVTAIEHPEKRPTLAGPVTSVTVMPEYDLLGKTEALLRSMPESSGTTAGKPDPAEFGITYPR